MTCWQTTTPDSADWDATGAYTERYPNTRNVSAIVGLAVVGYAVLGQTVTQADWLPENRDYGCVEDAGV